MARLIEKLTTKMIAKLNEPGRHNDGRGLALQITKAGVRSWILRYERDGCERFMGLGTLDDFNVEEARERAQRARKLLADGVDPIDHRREQRDRQKTEAALAAAKNVTFKSAARKYFDHHSKKWKNQKHRAQFLSSLEMYAFPTMGKLHAGAIDKTLVLSVLRPIWDRVNETASRVRGRIEQVLDYSKVQGWRDGDNPATWAGNLAHALPAPSAIRKTKHHPALPYEQVSEFIARLQERQGIATKALEFTTLVAARTEETIGAPWDEFDLSAKVWTIPAERMKMERDHRVPLSDRAIAILKSLPRDGDFVFPGLKKGEPMSNMAMATVIRRLNDDRTAKGIARFVDPKQQGRDVTVHGMRSTFRDWAGETTNHPNHVVEMALAHKIENAAEAAYRRGELFTKRTRLMNEWARFCATKQSEKTGDNVTPIRRARSV